MEVKLITTQGLLIVHLNWDFSDSGIYRIRKSCESLNSMNPGSDMG